MLSMARLTACGLSLLTLLGACVGQPSTEARTEPSTSQSDGTALADQADGAADVAPASEDATAEAIGDSACLAGASVLALQLGVSGIPEDTLGTVPGRYKGEKSAFHWAVPPQGWTVEAHLTHEPGWCGDDEPSVLWGASSGAAPVALSPGALTGHWDRGETASTWRGRVDAPLPGAMGLFTLRAALGDLSSLPVTVEVRPRTVDIDPFDEVDHWAITFSRDLGDLSVKMQGKTFEVKTLPGPDGTPDFVEALQALGFLGGDAAFQGAMLALFKQRIRSLLHTFYLLDPDSGALTDGSVRIQFAFEGDLALPPPEQWQAMGWSRIAVGGEDPGYKPGGQTFFGRAQVDWHNAAVNDNTLKNLGIFTTSLVRMVLTNSAGAALLKDYVPAAGGVPFGDVATDAAMLEAGFDPQALPPGQARDRGLRLELTFRLLALAIASVTAHEIGHSLGLVKPGLPPQGMLADVEGPWAVQLVGGGHVDTPGFNLMQTGSSFSLADLASGAPRFAPANLAYLRRQILMLK